MGVGGRFIDKAAGGVLHEVVVGGGGSDVKSRGVDVLFLHAGVR